MHRAAVCRQAWACYAATSIGPDLFKNSQNAVRYMIDHLVAEYELTRVEATAVRRGTSRLTRSNPEGRGRPVASL